jgi:hypothetical protein
VTPGPARAEETSVAHNRKAQGTDATTFYRCGQNRLSAGAVRGGEPPPVRLPCTQGRIASVYIPRVQIERLQALESRSDAKATCGMPAGSGHCCVLEELTTRGLGRHSNAGEGEREAKSVDHDLAAITAVGERCRNARLERPEPAKCLAIRGIRINAEPESTYTVERYRPGVVRLGWRARASGSSQGQDKERERCGAAAERHRGNVRTPAPVFRNESDAYRLLRQPTHQFAYASPPCS